MTIDTVTNKVQVLDALEGRFEELLSSGKLDGWSLEDIKDALSLLFTHKALAMKALEANEFFQASTNIDLAISIVSGFIEGSDAQELN